MDISFPAPVPYAGDEGDRGSPGRTHLAVDEHLVERAFRSTSSKKSPGPDGMGPLAIQCLFNRDRHRITEQIRTHIRLGVHPQCWKIARGVTIPKPGKDNYGLAKSYRVISLLNCLGKMVEKVAAMLVSTHCENTGGFHPVSTDAEYAARLWTQWEWLSHRPRRRGRGVASLGPCSWMSPPLFPVWPEDAFFAI